MAKIMYKKQDIRDFLKNKNIQYKSLSSNNQNRIESLREKANSGDIFRSDLYSGIEEIVDDNLGSLKEMNLADEVDSINSRYMKSISRLKRVVDFLFASKKSQISLIKKSEDQFYNKIKNMDLYSNIADIVDRNHKSINSMIDGMKIVLSSDKDRKAISLLNDRTKDIKEAKIRYDARIVEELKKY